MIWRAREETFALGERTLLMGIINVTPDSFSDGGMCMAPRQVCERVTTLAQEGADIVDIGAVSTRPGAAPVSETAELDRLLPALDMLAGNIQVPLSVDTTRARVAQEALRRGVHIVNDVSGLHADPDMPHIVKEYGAGIILMHMRGTPHTMQQYVQYDNLVEDVLRELRASVDAALAAGIAEECIAIDPGLGFAKTAEQNLTLLNRLSKFQTLGRPMVVGPSRKSFLGQVTGTAVEDRVFGTAAAVALSIAAGAHIVRVHDVKAMRDVVLTSRAILRAQPSLRGNIPGDAEAISAPRLPRRPFGPPRNDERVVMAGEE